MCFFRLFNTAIIAKGRDDWRVLSMRDGENRHLQQAVDGGHQWQERTWCSAKARY